MSQDWNDDAYYDDEYYDDTVGRSWSTTALILSGLIGILVGFACAVCLGGIGLAILLFPAGSDSSTASALPTPTATIVVPPAPAPTPPPANPPPPAPEQPLPAPEQPPPAPEQPPYASGGLGLTQQEWEQRYGPGSPGDTPGLIWYQGGTYVVAFQEGKVSSIERRWMPEDAATIDDSRLQSAELAPADRQYLQTYIPEDRLELVVDLYTSPTLTGRFSGNVWGGSEPGSFTITHTLLDYGVAQMVIALGSNP